MRRSSNFPAARLLPGLMDLHSHLFLHPYNETAWDDQVLKESEAYRTVRAVNHARATLAGRLHDAARSRHRRRRLCRRRAQAGDRGRPDTGSAPVRRRSRAIVATGILRPGARRSSGPIAASRKAPRKPAASTRSCAPCATRPATAPTGSRSMPTIAPDRTARPCRPFPSTSLRAAGRHRALARHRPVAAHATSDEGMRRADPRRRRHDRAWLWRHAADLRADAAQEHRLSSDADGGQGDQRLSRRICARRRRQRRAWRRRRTPSAWRARRASSSAAAAMSASSRTAKISANSSRWPSSA